MRRWIAVWARRAGIGLVIAPVVLARYGLNPEEQTRADTETLNREAFLGSLDVVAISIASYPVVADRYLMLPHGGSVGRGYGPIVVAKDACDLEQLRGKRIAVPGVGTTGYLVLRMLMPAFEPVFIPIQPYARVFQALRAGEVDAALLIHEGRLTYEREGFAAVQDIGRAWTELTGLPLPLGGNVIRRDLGEDLISDISHLLRESIRWALANRDLTLYHVRPTRGRVVIHETLGADFGGVLVSDCLSSYDDATETQHKCYAHHLRAIAKAIEARPGGGEGFLADAKALLKTAIMFKRMQDDLAPEERAELRAGLERRADKLLAPARADPLEEAVAKRLRKQRDHLFVFLDHAGVDATNNLAERQLRPAVIGRKLSCGNKTARGAATWERLASLAATCAGRGQSFRDLIASAARLPVTR